MKRNLAIIGVVVIILLLIFSSCKKEDPIHNFFTYELIKYEIDEGILEYYGKLEPEVEGYNYDITLFSTGITFDPVTGGFSGTGNLVVLELFSELSDHLVSGTYTYDPTESQDAGTFDFGTFGLFVNMDDQTGTAVLVNSGTIKISRTGEDYIIEFNCETLSGNPITGSYTGPLDKIL